MNILNSADTAATINLITRNARGTTTTSDGATAAGLTAKENLSHLISGGFDMLHPTSVFEGVPPFSFISNGDPLVNWTIYGNTVEGASVGEKTVNMYNKNNVTNEKDLSSSTGNLVNGPTKCVSEFIEISENTSYTTHNVTTYVLYNASKEYLTGLNIETGGIRNVTIDNTDAKYIRIACNMANKSTAMLNAGSIALPYEPYGYKIPVVCGGVTTNIYIDEPLTAGETITYNDTGVIIPTTMFLNTLSVDTTVQPEKVFIEYVK